MSKAAQDKSNPVSTRIVIRGDGSEGSDDAVKEFIDEWLVPTLVEEFIRVRGKPAMPFDRNTYRKLEG